DPCLRRLTAVAAVTRLPVTRAAFFFSSRRRHTRCLSDWSSDVCSSDLLVDVWTMGPRTVNQFWVNYTRQNGGRNAVSGDASKKRSEERRGGKECRSRWARSH